MDIVIGTTTMCNFYKYIFHLRKIHFEISGFDKQMDIVIDTSPIFNFDKYIL